MKKKGRKVITMNIIPEQDIKVEDLYFIDKLYSYRAIFDDEEIRAKADKIFEQTHSLKELDKFCKDAMTWKQTNPLVMHSEIPKKFLQACFDNYVPQNKAQREALNFAKDYANNIKLHREKGTNIIFAGYGDVGTGKTYLTVCMAKEIIKQQIGVKFINAVDLVNSIKEDFKISKYINIPVLILDDLGKERGTEWVCEQLYAILNARYLAEKPTIITTENSTEDLKNNYSEKGKAILSRLKENVINVAMIGEDYRIKKERKRK